MSALLLLVALAPVGWYLWSEHKKSTPSLCWPAMKGVLGLSYEADPPRMGGTWNGRKVAVESGAGGVTLTAWLNAETALRVECAPKDVVTKRAGMVVPDALPPTVPAFRDKLLARCSDKAAGSVVFDETMQQRLVALPAVDFVGEQFRVVWTVPALKDIDTAEALLGALCAVADGLESFPKAGGMPSAQAKRP